MPANGLPAQQLRVLPRLPLDTAPAACRHPGLMYLAAALLRFHTPVARNRPRHLRRQPCDRPTVAEMPLAHTQSFKLIPPSQRGVQKPTPARARDDLLAVPVGVLSRRRMQSDMSAFEMDSGSRHSYWDTVLRRSPTSATSIVASAHLCSNRGHVLRTSIELHQHGASKHAKQARPYQCRACPSQFSQRSHLNQHVRSIHEKLKPFKCNDCGKSFAKRFDLNAHVDAVHNKKRPHGCPHCPTMFAKRSNLKRHIEKLHPSAPQYLPR